MAIDDAHIEWQLFIDGPFSLDTLVAAALEAAPSAVDSRPFTTDWGSHGVRIWNAAMLADVIDGHDYELDGVLDFANFRFMVDLEDYRGPGDSHFARRFAVTLFDGLRSKGARRLLLVDDLQGFVRDFDASRDVPVNPNSSTPTQERG